MAVDPSGQTIPSSYFYERGYSAGYNAASGGQSRTLVDQAMQSMPEFQDPRYQATASDKSSFKSGFGAGYDKVYASKKAEYGDPYTKTVAEAEKTAAQQKTVEQWENEPIIPSWSVAKAVATNFKADAEAFLAAVVQKPAPMSQAGLAFGARVSAFQVTTQKVNLDVQGEKYASPSAAVAEIRNGRKALNALKLEYKSLTGTTVPVAPSKQVAVTPPSKKEELPIAAKAPFPLWGVLAALGIVGVGGYFLFFHKKGEEAEPMGVEPEAV